MKEALVGLAFSLALALPASAAQPSRALTDLLTRDKNFTPIEEAACQGYGRWCPPGYVRACGPYRCWCRPCRR